MSGNFKANSSLTRKRALSNAITRGDLQDVEDMLQSGIPVNERATLKADFPVEIAIRSLQYEMTEVLLSYGAEDTNRTNFNEHYTKYKKKSLNSISECFCSTLMSQDGLQSLVSWECEKQWYEMFERYEMLGPRRLYGVLMMVVSNRFPTAGPSSSRRSKARQDRNALRLRYFIEKGNYVERMRSESQRDREKTQGCIDALFHTAIEGYDCMSINFMIRGGLRVSDKMIDEMGYEINKASGTVTRQMPTADVKAKLEGMTVLEHYSNAFARGEGDNEAAQKWHRKRLRRRFFEAAILKSMSNPINENAQKKVLEELGGDATQLRSRLYDFTRVIATEHENDLFQEFGILRNFLTSVFNGKLMSNWSEARKRCMERSITFYWLSRTKSFVPEEMGGAFDVDEFVREADEIVSRRVESEGESEE